MKRTIFNTSIITTLLILGSVAFSQTPDATGCKDHPFFNRMDKFYIQSCNETYDEHEFVTGVNEIQKVEGTVTEIVYSYDSKIGANMPSKMQVIRYYEDAIANMGGEKAYLNITDEGNWEGATFHFMKDGDEYWLGIYNLVNNPVNQYTFVLVVNKGVEQGITKSQMFETINSGESLRLYIDFDSQMFDIKSKSQGIIDELADMLMDNPTLNIIVEGHTNNFGDEMSDQILSENRALSVKQALVEKGITSNRIEAVGYGQDNPIADKDTEEGRAQNRRIEIRKCEAAACTDMNNKM